MVIFQLMVISRMQIEWIDWAIATFLAVEIDTTSAETWAMGNMIRNCMRQNLTNLQLAGRPPPLTPLSFIVICLFTCVIYYAMQSAAVWARRQRLMRRDVLSLGFLQRTGKILNIARRRPTTFNNDAQPTTHKMHFFLKNSSAGW